MARRTQPSIPDQLLDQFLAGGDPRDTLAGKDGLLEALKKALAERALNAEMDHHLESGEPDGRPNTRNGYGRKTVRPIPAGIPAGLSWKCRATGCPGLTRCWWPSTVGACQASMRRWFPCTPVA